MDFLAVALAFTDQAASPEGKSKFSFKDSFHGAIAFFRRICQGGQRELDSYPFTGVHHLDPLLAQVHLHSQDQDHRHPQTTRSENSHHQQVEEECLALGCPTHRKLLPLQSPLAFLDVFDDLGSGLIIFQDQEPLRIVHFVYFYPVRGPPV